ncbi:MAG: zinc-binding dehydrogenase [Gemmatimonadetes bacterium]|nr:zinc-binding dehydrogenase [Gemmatimonadota bacterium]
MTYVPDEMDAVVLDAYSGPASLRVARRAVPKPGPGQVLVKIAASPMNPSDIAFIHGNYGFRSPPPVVPGQEGAGTVVAAGAGMIGRYFLNKRVACLKMEEGDGMWAEYALASAVGGVLPLSAAVGMEQGAMSAINPMTACAFLEIARRGGHRAFALTPGASSLGQMVNRLARRRGVEVINVVRRRAQVDLLRDQGVTVVLNSSDEDFVERLRDACREHDCHLAFDAVAGPSTHQLLDAMPHNSKVTVFSGLSKQPARAGIDHLVFEGKSVDGFWLGPWLLKKNPLGILRTWRRAQALVPTALESTIRERVPLQDAARAMREYMDRMTGGKFLLEPGLTAGS